LSCWLRFKVDSPGNICKKGLMPLPGNRANGNLSCVEMLA
jgi:hypothetical protein